MRQVFLVALGAGLVLGWATWVPRQGDILLCTRAKCGTTWTQTMLLQGGGDMPAKLPVLSPWVDAELGATVIAVDRHPLDVLFSLRKHRENMANPVAVDQTGRPVAQSYEAYIHDPTDPDNRGQENLASVVMHYDRTALSGRLPDLKLYHYAELVPDAAARHWLDRGGR